MKLPTLLWIFATPAILLSADRTVIGLTRARTAIEAVSVAATAAHPPVVLIVAGLGGETAKLVAREVNQYAVSKRRPYQLLAIPLANPNKAQLIFPPTGRAYKEAHPAF